MVRSDGVAMALHMLSTQMEGTTPAATSLSHVCACSLEMQEPISGHEKSGLVHYDDMYFSTIARIANVLLSIILPSSTMVGLYLIKSMAARLGAVMAFSTLFSLVLAIFTNARPVEIFTATAA
jgi:hypothetical protein